MNRLNALLTLVIAVIFVLLMFFAGQPITPEADLVNQWYAAICNPQANQSVLYDLTWRGYESDAQLQAIIDAFRSTNGFSDGCTAIENHNFIYFQSIPSELANAVDWIKFVSVNVYRPDQPHQPNHVYSIEFGVHVLFYKNGVVKILPHFIPDSPLGLQQGPSPITLYNNDGLLMGQVQLTGELIQIPHDDLVRYGIPLQFSPVRAWGRAWVRIYVDGIQVTLERFKDILPVDQQPAFLPAFIENWPANKIQQGSVWFSLPNTAHPSDVRLSVDAYQTLWDMPGVPIMLKVN